MTTRMHRLRRVASSAAAGASLALGWAGAARLPGLATAGTLQRLPDTTLQWLAAGSAGLSTGFYLAGVPRPLVAISASPVVMLGAAILLRPFLTATPVARHWWSRTAQAGTP